MRASRALWFSLGGLLVASRLLAQSGVPGPGPGSTQAERDRDRGRLKGEPEHVEKQEKIDQALAQRIRRSIAADTTLSMAAQHIKVTAQDGVVTLSGVVKSEQEKRLVTEKAADAAGVLNVRLALDVTP